MLLEINVVYDAVVPGAATPARGLSLETFDVSSERILFHRYERRFNARLILWRKVSEVFSCGIGELKVPIHEGIGLMIQHSHAGKQRDRDAKPRVPFWSAALPDSGARNRRGGLRGPTRSACEIPPSGLARIAAPLQVARKSSSSVLFSWFLECYSVTLVVYRMLLDRRCQDAETRGSPKFKIDNWTSTLSRV